MTFLGRRSRSLLGGSLRRFGGFLWLGGWSGWFGFGWLWFCWSLSCRCLVVFNSAYFSVYSAYSPSSHHLQKPAKSNTSSSHHSYYSANRWSYLIGSTLNYVVWAFCTSSCGWVWWFAGALWLFHRWIRDEACKLQSCPARFAVHRQVATFWASLHRLAHFQNLSRFHVHPKIRKWKKFSTNFLALCSWTTALSRKWCQVETDQDRTKSARFAACHQTLSLPWSIVWLWDLFSSGLSFRSSPPIHGYRKAQMAPTIISLSSSFYSSMRVTNTAFKL